MYAGTDRICLLTIGELSKALKDNPCPDHGVSIPAAVIQPDSADYCLVCAKRWERVSIPAASFVPGSRKCQ